MFLLRYKLRVLIYRKLKTAEDQIDLIGQQQDLLHSDWLINLGWVYGPCHDALSMRGQSHRPQPCGRK